MPKNSVICLQEIDEVMANLSKFNNSDEKSRREQEELARIKRNQRRLKQEVRDESIDIYNNDRPPGFKEDQIPGSLTCV